MGISSVRRTAGLLAAIMLHCMALAHADEAPFGERRAFRPVGSSPGVPVIESPTDALFEAAEDPTRAADFADRSPFGDDDPVITRTAYGSSDWDPLGMSEAAPGDFSRNGRLSDLAPDCDPCPDYGGYLFVGYDSWRGVSDGSWGNNGIHTGANVGMKLGSFSDWTGIGFQIGGSVGVYNWNGTDYKMFHPNAGTTQGFLTYGFFRKARDDSRWSASIVQDWMFNSNFSVFGQDPTLMQFRGQLGYAVTSADEFGVWGAWRGWGDTKNVPHFGPVTWRPIDQASLYWHHKWGIGEPDTWLWVGIPERDRLAGNGSLGDYYVGVLANAPLNDVVSLYAQVTYMHPSSSPGGGGATEDQWNFFIGLALYPGRNARSRTVAGRCWMPQMPVANNGTFLVDASANY